MHTNRSRITAILAWAMFWLLLVLVAVQDFRRDGNQGVWQPILWESSSALVFTALLLVQRHFTKRHDELVTTPWRWFAIQARWLPLYWVAFTPLVFGIRHGVYALVGLEYEHEPWTEVVVYEALKITVFVGLFTAAAFGLLSYRQMLGERLRAEQAVARLREAQLERLTRQMQPHFLFNALNTVSSLMHVDVARADATLIQLSEVLRATLALGEQPQARLEDELRLARGYAAVMAERFDGRVSLDWQIDDALMNAMLPAVSLQPLLENVFKHTVERRRSQTSIKVNALREGDELVLRVEDDAGRLDGAGTPGIGVANLRARLAALHGERARFTLTQREPAGVRAEMRLPCAS